MPGERLTGAVTGSSGAAGTIEVDGGASRARGRRTCVLAGYPGLQLLGPGGSSLPTNVLRKGNYPFTAMAPATVTLGAGPVRLLQHRLLRRAGGRRDELPDLDDPRGHAARCHRPLVVAAALAPCGGGTMVVSPVFAASEPGQPDDGAPDRLSRLVTGAMGDASPARRRAGPAPGPSPRRPGSARGPGASPSRPTSSWTMPSRRSAGQAVAIASHTARRSAIGREDGVDAEEGDVAHDEGVDGGLEGVAPGEPAGGHRRAVAQGAEHGGQRGPAHAVHGPGPPFGAEGALRCAGQVVAVDDLGGARGR